jgi:hypothetical protein
MKRNDMNQNRRNPRRNVNKMAKKAVDRYYLELYLNSARRFDDLIIRK